MIANDHIPRPDARFDAWHNNFGTYVNGHLADLGIEAADVVDHALPGEGGTQFTGPPGQEDPSAAVFAIVAWNRMVAAGGTVVADYANCTIRLIHV